MRTETDTEKTQAVDWSKPIEAIDSNGTVWAAEAVGPLTMQCDREKYAYAVEVPFGLFRYNAQGRSAGTTVTVRNVAVADALLAETPPAKAAEIDPEMPEVKPRPWVDGQRFHWPNSEEPEFYVKGNEVLYDAGHHEGKLSHLTIATFENAIDSRDLVPVDSPPPPAVGERWTQDDLRDVALRVRPDPIADWEPVLNTTEKRVIASENKLLVRRFGTRLTPSRDMANPTDRRPHRRPDKAAGVGQAGRVQLHGLTSVPSNTNTKG